MGKNVLDETRRVVVTLLFLFWDHVWTKDNSVKILTARQEAIDASEKAGEKIGTLLKQACVNLVEKERPQTLGEFFTPKYLLNADIDWGSFISIDLCLKEIKRSSKLLQFFRSCSEKEFEQWYAKRKPIDGNLQKERWNLASARHAERVNRAEQRVRHAEQVKRAKERVGEQQINSPRGGNFQSGSIYNGSSSYSSAKEGFNTRRGYD